jgi:tetratricopeptide (TPR) repeat protein
LDLFDMAFLRGDKAALESAAALGHAKSASQDWVTYHEAFVAAYTGHLKEAETTARRAVDLARQAGQPERAALFESASVLWDALFGNTGAATHRAATGRERTLQPSPDRETQYAAALALALAGESSRPEAVANGLEKRFPEDTSVRFSYVPVLRALAALNRHEPAKAIDSLQTSAVYELGLPRTTMHGNFGALYPVYVRGLAYLDARQGREATAEFQKIIDHRGLVINDPIGALAHLQIGRAYALSGDNTKAKSAYQDFLTLWKDADAGIPIFKEARSEFARLQ